VEELNREVQREVARASKIPPRTRVECCGWYSVDISTGVIRVPPDALDAGEEVLRGELAHENGHRSFAPASVAAYMAVKAVASALAPGAPPAAVNAAVNVVLDAASDTMAATRSRGLQEMLAARVPYLELLVGERGGPDALTAFKLAFYRAVGDGRPGDYGYIYQQLSGLSEEAGLPREVVEKLAEAADLVIRAALDTDTPEHLARISPHTRAGVEEVELLGRAAAALATLGGGGGGHGDIEASSADPAALYNAMAAASYILQKNCGGCADRVVEALRKVAPRELGDAVRRLITRARYLVSARVPKAYHYTHAGPAGAELWQVPHGEPDEEGVLLHQHLPDPLSMPVVYRSPGAPGSRRTEAPVRAPPRVVVVVDESGSTLAPLPSRRGASSPVHAAEVFVASVAVEALAALGGAEEVVVIKFSDYPAEVFRGPRAAAVPHILAPASMAWQGTNILAAAQAAERGFSRDSALVFITDAEVSDWEASQVAGILSSAVSGGRLAHVFFLVVNAGADPRVLSTVAQGLRGADTAVLAVARSWEELEASLEKVLSTVARKAPRGSPGGI